MEQEQVKVNSLTHMVVVVDENSGDRATAALEEQLQVMTTLLSGKKLSVVLSVNKVEEELLVALGVSQEIFLRMILNISVGRDFCIDG